MAKTQDGPIITMKADGGSCPAYRCVAMASSGTDYVATVHRTATSLLFGVSVEDASASAEAWPIKVYGTAKVMCAISVTAGVAVGAQTATGKVLNVASIALATATALPAVLGVALQAGNTNSIIEVLIQTRGRITIS